MQQLNEQANAANAVAEFTTAMGEKYAAYSSLSGKAAVDGYKPYLEDLNSTREAIGQKLNSPYAQKVYLQESRSIQARSVFLRRLIQGAREELCDWLNPVAD